MKETDIIPIEIHQRFSVPAEDVFDAWTDPLIVNKWMFLGEFNNIIQVIIDLRPAGEFSIVKKTDEGYFRDYYGKYHEVNRPALLSFSLEAPDVFEGVSNVVLRINSTSEGCEMVLLQTGVDPAVTERPWRLMFERLSQLYENKNEQPAGRIKVNNMLL
jgi:uncharacterized protein YndB with AHSA1/START domain